VIRGFTLIEMATVLVIISLVLAGGLTITARDIENERISTTNQRLLYVQRAVEAYALAFDHVPCPADPALNPADTAFGVGVGTNNGVGVACAAGNIIPITKLLTQIGTAGAVPFVNLGISPIYMFDGWNRKITYVVDGDLTDAAGYTGGEGDLQLVDEVDSNHSLVGAEDITLWDNISSLPDPNFVPRTQGVVVLLISHGKNGHGAYRAKNGTIINVPVGTGSGQAEADNANALTMNGTFRLVPYNQGRANPNRYFDDIVYYRTKWQLENRPEDE
jgi:prepilin-type N-terminal cleavage/methylation domain-containing protein